MAPVQYSEPWMAPETEVAKSVYEPPGAGLPGAGLPGAGLPGAGLPGAGLPGAGLPGAELPGAGPTVHMSSLVPKGGDMLAMFLSLMPDAAVVVNSRGTIVAVNERAEGSFGYSASELEGKPIELLVPERSRHAHRSERAGYSSEPVARPMGAGLELYARRKDGTEIPVDISLAPIGGDEEPLVVAAVRDITDRKAAQAVQAQLAAIVQSSAEGIFSMTHCGVITSWNHAAEAMLGYERREVVGHHVGQFFPNDPVLEEMLANARSGEPAPSRDTCWNTRDGRAVDVAISVSLLDLGNDRGYSVLVRDITARKAAEVQLRHQAAWQAAMSEVRLSLLSEARTDEILDLVCRWAVELSSATASALVVGSSEGPHLAGSAGDGSVLARLALDLDKVLLAAKSGVPSPVPELSARAFPVSLPSTAGTMPGALVVLGPGLGSPEEGPDQVLSSMAGQAVLAFELAKVRAERDRLVISADRERIARDLHDLVIQRLFGAGLRLQGALGLIDSRLAAARVASTVDDLDVTIREIREAIFALESVPGTGLRARAQEVVADAAEALGFKPAVSFHGATDSDVELHIQAEAAAVLTEALSNVARHANADRAEVHITLDDDLTVLVVDNGTGIGRPERLSGIANARARAELSGGSLKVVPADGGGTRFEWRVPLSPGPT